MFTLTHQDKYVAFIDDLAEVNTTRADLREGTSVISNYMERKTFANKTYFSCIAASLGFEIAAI